MGEASFYPIALAICALLAAVSGACAGFAWVHARPRYIRSLAESVEEISRAFPAWKVSMQELATECERSLEGAQEYNRKAAAKTNGARGGRPSVEEQVPVEQLPRRQQIEAIAAAYRDR